MRGALVVFTLDDDACGVAVRGMTCVGRRYFEVLSGVSRYAPAPGWIGSDRSTKPSMIV